MPTGTFGPIIIASASGWANSGNLSASDGAYATANYSIVAGEPNPTPDLALGFGMDLSGHTPIGIYFEGKGHKSNLSVLLSATPTVNGVGVAAARGIVNLGTSDSVFTSGSSGDMWGTSITTDDALNFGFVVNCSPSGANGVGVASLDYVIAAIYYEYPNSFAFTDATNQPLSTTVASDVLTISGITQPAKVVVSGGDWRKNGGAWTNFTGTVSNGDTVQVRNTTSASFSTSVNTTLTVGGVSDTFTTTTAAADSTPDAFDFADVSAVDPGATGTSNTVTVAGINTTVTASATNGATLIKNGVGVGSSTTVVSGDTLVAQLGASGAFGGSNSTTITIGTGSDTFTVFTRNADVTPNAYAWTDVSGQPISTLVTSNTVTMAGMDAGQNATITFTISGAAAGTYERNVNGGGWVAFVNNGTATIQNGQTLQIRITTSAGTGATHNVTTNIGGTADTWTVTNTTSDSTPDPFDFIDVPTALFSAAVLSNIVTISGIDTTSNGSFSTGGSGTSMQYRKNGGAWTALGAFTVVNGDTLQLQMTAPATIGQTGTITTTIGGVADAWTVTSNAADTTPNPFAFTDVTNASFSTQYASSAVAVTGINSPTAISVSGDATAQYSVNGGAFTSSAGTVNNGDTVQARLTSANAYVTRKDAVVTIGGVSDTFSVTTRAQSPTSQYVLTFRESRFGVRF